jgi:hypothetical protein
MNKDKTMLQQKLEENEMGLLIDIQTNIESNIEFRRYEDVEGRKRFEEMNEYLWLLIEKKYRKGRVL